MPLTQVPSPMLSPGTAGTGPAFSAYQSSAQTLSGSTYTKIQFQTEEWDTASCFDNTTNYRFTPNVAGYYSISGSITMGASATGIILYIFKNGGSYRQLLNTFSSSVSSGSGSTVVYLNGSTDYVELYGYVGTGQVLAASLAQTWFQGALVRAA